MKSWIQMACEAADGLLAAAMGEQCPIPSRYSRRGCIANPAPRARKLGEEVLARMPTSQWFEKITIEGGFLNFYFSELWYHQTAELVLSVEGQKFIAQRPVPDCPANIEAWDWAFLSALYPKGERAARLAPRQDEENPGWLVRYTVRRLQDVQERAPVRRGLTAQECALLRMAALMPEEAASAKRLALHLEQTARMVWEISPQRLEKRVCRCLAGAMTAGMSLF